MAVVIALEAGPVPASAEPAIEAEAIYDDLVQHAYYEGCRRCWEARGALWQRDRLCSTGAALVDDYAAAMLRAAGSALDAGAAMAVRMGYPEPAPRPVVVGGAG